MKIKIYQTGGIVYTPTVNRSNYGEASNTGASSNNSSDDAGKVPGFSKELISILKENGLDNDVQYFLNSVGRMVDLANDPIGQNLSMKQILKAQALANKVKMNYSEYEKARTSLDNQDAWAEIATTKRGEIYVIDSEGKISTTSYSNYNPETQQALTFADLMNYRRSSPDATYRTDILDDVSSAIGMESIIKYANELIKEFGTTTITGYSEKAAGKINSGLDLLQSGSLDDFAGVLKAGPDGIYKISSERTIADTGIKEAMNYLYSSLPKAFKNTLAAKATVEEYSPDALLLNMMLANTNRKITADYEHTATDDLFGRTGRGSASGNTSEKYEASNLAIDFIMGDLTQTDMFLSPKAQKVNDTSQYTFAAWNGGRPQDDDNNRFGVSNVGDIAKDITQLAGVDMTSITLGNQVIDSSQLSKLIWNGDSNVYRVSLPKKYENGKMVPDFDLLIAYNKFLDWSKTNPNASSIEKNAKRQEIMGADSNALVWDDESQTYLIREERLGIFGTLGVIGSKDLIKLEDKSKPFVDTISRQEGKEMIDMFNNIVKYGKEYHTKSEKPRTGIDKSGAGDLYRANLYFAITDPMQALNVTKNKYRLKDNFIDPNKKWELGQQLLAARTLSTYKTNFN